MHIALRSLANGKLVCAENEGKEPLIANRDAVGPWETFDVPGLEEAIRAIVREEIAAIPVPPTPEPPEPPTPEPPDPGPGFWPAYIVPREGADYVGECKAYLAAHGQDFHSPCGAFTITEMAAWGLRQQGWGLRNKPGGNGCDGYSVDVLVHRDGRWVDCIISAETDNIPAWQVGGGPAPADWWAAPRYPF